MSQYINKIRTKEGDKQIDYNALANLPTISNPNLLINSDFRNPINQRGKTTYTGGEPKVYTIDRWCMGNNDFSRTVNIVNGGVKITNPNTTYNATFQQIFENALPQGTYTISVNVISKNGDGIFYCTSPNSSTKKNLVVGLNTLTLTDIAINSVRIEVSPSSDITLEWVKLEIGDTATPFSPRPYAEEVILCKRFYQVETIRNSDVICYLHKRNNTSYGGVKHFEPMRTIPAVTRSGDFYIEQYNSSGQIYSTTEDKISFIEITPQWSELKIIINLSTSDPVNYLAATSSTVVFKFDAEIY